VIRTRFKIIFAPTAEKQFLRLNKLVRVRIAAAVAKLADEPLLGKLLKGQLKEYRSYRVGDYRVIYYSKQREVFVYVVAVAHRRDV
jgi:mRNA interferase RelE/StbE